MSLAALTARQRASQLFVLTAFALAQPLFALLGDQPDFFVAHRARPADLLLLAGVIVILPPALLLLVEQLTLRLSPVAGRRLHWLQVALLAALVTLPLLSRIPRMPGWLAVGLALACGVGASFTVARVAAARTFLTLLAPAVVVFPLYFLLFTPARSIVLPRPIDAVAPAAVTDPAPVVMIVFDELSLPFLLDHRGRIDAKRYPSFARLARHSHWFRGATTVADHTVYAVPAIVNGRYPDKDRIPTAESYPQTLFTLLRDSHRLHVRETLTDLCPHELCGEDPNGETWTERSRSMLSDLAILELHLLLPDELTSGLPAVDEHWRDFGRSSAREDQLAIFERFVASLDDSPEPAFHFLHVLLPHRPWKYRPNGTVYRSDLQGARRATWSTERRFADRGLERYIWQTRFVDSLLGRFLDRLEEVGLFDRALVIVTADHGVSFIPGSPLRRVEDSNFHEVMPVPLFVKRPGQRRGVVDARNVETIDIAPTVLHLLGADPAPLAFDGAALFGDDFEERSKKIVFATSRRLGKRHEIDPAALGASSESTARMRATLRRLKLEKREKRKAP